MRRPFLTQEKLLKIYFKIREILRHLNQQHISSLIPPCPRPHLPTASLAAQLSGNPTIGRCSQEDGTSSALSSLSRVTISHQKSISYPFQLWVKEARFLVSVAERLGSLLKLSYHLEDRALTQAWNKNPGMWPPSSQLTDGVEALPWKRQAEKRRGSCPSQRPESWLRGFDLGETNSIRKGSPHALLKETDFIQNKV